MTVKELITKLQEHPEDAQVVLWDESIRDWYSEYVVLRHDPVKNRVEII